MKNNSDSFLAGRIKSIQHALDGIAEMFKSQSNAKVHFSATILVILVAMFFNCDFNRMVSINSGYYLGFSIRSVGIQLVNICVT